MNTLLCVLALVSFAVADWQTCTGSSDTTTCDSEETCCSCKSPRTLQSVNVCLEPEHCSTGGLCDTDRNRESSEEEDNDHEREEEVCGCSVDAGGFNFLRCAVPFHRSDKYDDWDEDGNEKDGNDDSEDNEDASDDKKREDSEDDDQDSGEEGEVDSEEEGDDDFHELNSAEQGRRCGCIQRFTRCGDDCQITQEQRRALLTTVCSGLPGSFSGCAVCKNYYQDPNGDGLLTAEQITAFIATFEHAIEDYITAQVSNIDSFDLVYVPATATDPETVTVSVTVSAGATFVPTDVLDPLRFLFNVDANTFQLNVVNSAKRAGTTYGYLDINDQSSASSLAIGLFALCIAVLALF